MGTVTGRRSAGRLGGRAATLVLFATVWLGSGLGGVGPVAAAGSTFGAPTATSTFGTSVVFNQPVNLASPPDRVEILILAPGSIGPTVSEVAVPGAGTRTLRFVLSLATAHLFPNTTLSASWRLVFGTQAVVGPSVSVTYADTRFAWRTQTGSIVRIHWYQGDAAFGARALAIAERGVQTAEQLLGVKETAPIDFFVYAAQSPFYDALGPGTRENVGGEAVAEIRTLFALITPDEVNASWVSTVLPHELTHLVFNTAVANPYHFPPRWLNEGLAVYLSQGYDPTDRGLVASAVAAGNLTPLNGLAGQFPSTQGQFYLAYAESVSAVDYLIRTYGRPALVSLIKSYASGVTDDEAFTAALGVDTATFDRAWLASLGAAVPAKVGPQPAPPGPVPPGWSGGGPAGTGAAAGPSSPAPGSVSPTAAPAGSAAPASSTPTDFSPLVAVLAIVVGGAILVTLGLRGRSDRT